MCCQRYYFRYVFIASHTHQTLALKSKQCACYSHPDNHILSRAKWMCSLLFHTFSYTDKISAHIPHLAPAISSSSHQITPAFYTHNKNNTISSNAVAASNIMMIVLLPSCVYNICSVGCWAAIRLSEHI